MNKLLHMTKAELKRYKKDLADQLRIVEADALVPDTLPAALEGIDTAYYLVHSMAAGKDFPRLDREAADYFAARSQLEPALDEIALQLQQQVVQDHRESKFHGRHLLALADFYADLARRYVRRVPATALDFEPAVFDEYANGATRIIPGHGMPGADKALLRQTREMWLSINRRLEDHAQAGRTIDEVLAANQKSVDEFRAGKEKAFNALVGQAMKATKGKANPALVNELLKKKLG